MPWTVSRLVADALRFPRPPLRSCRRRGRRIADFLKQFQKQLQHRTAGTPCFRLRIRLPPRKKRGKTSARRGLQAARAGPETLPCGFLQCLALFLLASRQAGRFGCQPDLPPTLRAAFRTPGAQDLPDWRAAVAVRPAFLPLRSGAPLSGRSRARSAPVRGAWLRVAAGIQACRLAGNCSLVRTSRQAASAEEKSGAGGSWRRAGLSVPGWTDVRQPPRGGGGGRMPADSRMAPCAGLRSLQTWTCRARLGCRCAFPE